MKDLKKYEVKVEIHNRVLGPQGNPISISTQSYIREFVIYQPNMQAVHDWLNFVHSTGITWIGQYNIKEVK